MTRSRPKPKPRSTLRERCEAAADIMARQFGSEGP